MDKQEAQRRVDRIQAFRDELKAVRGEGVLELSEEDLRRLDQFHNDTLKKLAGQFDVDTSSGEKRLSWGMRIASFLGALALSAAVFFFFYRFWGFLTTPAQVGILIGAPLLAILGTEYSSRREKSLYFTSLLALVAFTCFVLNLSVLGAIFNIVPSQNAFLAWGAFGLIFAYTYGLKLLLVAGITSLMGYLAATVGTWSGMYWLSFGERPENFIAAGFFLFLASFIPGPHRFGSQAGFRGIYRVYGLLAVFISILILSNWGRISYITLPGDLIEYAYQITGFLVAGLTIWLGIRFQWPGTTNLGSTFFVMYLYTKFFDWWWHWMPKYLFFLLIGLVAILLLLVFRRVRTAGRMEAE